MKQIDAETCSFLPLALYFPITKREGLNNLEYMGHIFHLIFVTISMALINNEPLNQYGKKEATGKNEKLRVSNASLNDAGYIMTN